MASNLPIAGFGRALPAGGFGGPGLVTGTASFVQNPSYETPGTNVGEAVNWTTAVVSTLSEYAVFDHPGSNIITDQIPAEQPVLGYTVTHQLDGTLVISQATDADSAQEDFEQGWSGNEGFELIFYDPANESVSFRGQTYDGFDDGWGNDSGLLSNIDAIGNVAAVFNTLPVEKFAAGWPAGFSGVLLTEIPNVVFGTYNDTTGIFTPNDEIIAAGQYADLVTLRVISPTAPVTVFVLNIIDQNNLTENLPVNVLTPHVFGDVIAGGFLAPFGVGIRNINTATIGPGSAGIYSVEGDPGFKRDEHGTIVAKWERAVFG